MSDSENRKIVQQAYAAFGSGDIPAFLALLSEDIDWRIPAHDGSPFASQYKGRDQVGRFCQELDAAEEIVTFEPREFIAEGGRVVVLGSYSAKVKSTGRTYVSEWVHAFTVSNSQITAMQELSDTGAIAKAYQTS